MIRTACSGSGIRVGYERIALTVILSGPMKIVSPVRSTPRPSAPSRHNSTQLPGKCPPHCTRVTPGSGLSRPPQCRIAGSGRRLQAASSEAT
ncbi:hypothetical protein [Cryobacterium psychrotolerans]|uniref:hypothetical protein n=1 Tax=Cryobacterium psychrotolerans TaxID=386301 RepID=UPI00142F4B7C|nr:hypothetical protein [Cryobacterium psychrotolerans]